MDRSIDDRGPAQGCPSEFNLAAYVLEAGRTTPEKEALVIARAGEEELWTFGTLRRDVLGLAGHLSDRGLARGDRVLIRLGNVPQFPISFLAAAAADLVPVLVSNSLTKRELSKAAAAVRPALVVTDPALSQGEYDCPVLPLDDLDGAMAETPLAPVRGDPERPGYIVFTSGTGAEPRAVLHAHRAVWARRMMWDGWYGLSPEDRMLHAGAFNWTFTLGTGLLDPWAAGATALIPPPEASPEELAAMIPSFDATLFAAAPGIYRQLLRVASRLDAPKLRHGLSAGEKLSERIRADWRHSTGCPLHEAFGMSECSTFISGSPEDPASPGTLGRAQRGRCVAVLDSDGVPLPRAEFGRLAVSAQDPGLMLGYLDTDGMLELPLENEWFVTGDRAAMDPDGMIRYAGRNDDIINAGGIRVSPLEVEAALSEYEGILECAVTEVSVKADVTVIAAFYVAATDLDEEDIRSHMTTTLARHKAPRIYMRTLALPRNANGKLQRRELRDAWEAKHDQA